MAVEYKSYLKQLADSDPRYEALPATGKSPVERLLDDLQAHEAAERETLADYREAAEHAPDQGVAFLMRLILEDEERHHRLMAAMARDVADTLWWVHEDSPLPSIDPLSPAKGDLLGQTERFLRIEHDTIEQLHTLRRAVKDMRSGLPELIVDGMEADTRKHIDMLKYIRTQLGRG